MREILQFLASWFWKLSRRAERKAYPPGTRYVHIECPRARRRAVRLAARARWLEDKARRIC
jgi:hypothetical protein